MLLHIVARGCIGRGPEADLVQRYAKRLSWPFRITELPDTGGKMPALEPHTRLVLLGETGSVLPSRDIAAPLGRWRDDAWGETPSVIGAPAGCAAAEGSEERGVG